VLEIKAFFNFFIYLITILLVSVVSLVSGFSTCHLKQGGWQLPDLAAFLVSMIAPVKKSVNHLRTVTIMRIMREEAETCVAAIFVQDLPSIR